MSKEKYIGLSEERHVLADLVCSEIGPFPDLKITGLSTQGDDVTED